MTESMDGLLRAARSRPDQPDADRLGRLHACIAAGLPAALADRLEGSNAQEWEDDAKRLAASVRNDATTMDEHIRSEVSERQKKLRNRFPIR